MREREKIIVTGDKGTIGTVLKKGLTDYDITGLDLPTHDLRKYEAISAISKGHRAIIHLAWDTKVDNFLSGKINEDNSRMFFNVYQAALENGVPRVIVASSVHADKFYKWEGEDKMSPYQLPSPDSPYGAHKVFMESLGKYYSQQGLEVVCIRFGGIGPTDSPNRDFPPERAVFLSHKDSISLVQAILKAKTVPNKFTIVYGISNNTNAIHDTSNPFGWAPQDNADDFK